MKQKDTKSTENTHFEKIFPDPRQRIEIKKLFRFWDDCAKKHRESLMKDHFVVSLHVDPESN